MTLLSDDREKGVCEPSRTAALRLRQVLATSQLAPCGGGRRAYLMCFIEH